MDSKTRDRGIEDVRAELAHMFDAGEKDRLLDTVCELLRQMLQDNDQLAAQKLDLLKKLYGKKTERIDPATLLQAVAEMTQEAAPSPEDPDTPAVTERPSEVVPRVKQPVKRGRRPLPAQLERVEIRLTPTAEQLAATSGQMSKMDEERSEVLEYEPGRFKVLVYIREVWSNAVGQIVTAPVPDKVIDKGLPGPRLLAHVIVSKYRDHLPLARQVQIFRRLGVELSKNTLVDWMAAVAHLLQPLARAIFIHAMASYVLQVDDTRLPVQDRHQVKKLKKGHLWALSGDHRYIAYAYTDNWRAETAFELLGARIGWMQVDGYKGYERIFDMGLAVAVGCWMHCRRYFVRAFDKKDLRAAIPLDLIRRMYAVEAAAKEAGDSHEQRLARRQRETQPLVDELRRWLDEHKGRSPPSELLAKAITYADNHWELLCQPLKDGALALDNGDVERELRGTALGRKNWLFAGSDAGAQNAAIIKTVLDTAVRQGLDPGEYLQDVLIKLSSGWLYRRLDELLPEPWQRLHGPQARVEQS